MILQRFSRSNLLIDSKNALQDSSSRSVVTFDWSQLNTHFNTNSFGHGVRGVPIFTWTHWEFSVPLNRPNSRRKYGQTDLPVDRTKFPLLQQRRNSVNLLGRPRNLSVPELRRHSLWKIHSTQASLRTWAVHITAFYSDYIKRVLLGAICGDRVCAYAATRHWAHMFFFFFFSWHNFCVHATNTAASPRIGASKPILRLSLILDSLRTVVVNCSTSETECIFVWVWQSRHRSFNDK